MCLNPRSFISKNNTFLGGNVSSRFKAIYDACNITSKNLVVVPCGKCSDCLKKRQSDLAARCAAEARAKGSMCFVTLTYRNECLPVAAMLEFVDKVSGEISFSQSLVQCGREAGSDVVRALQFTQFDADIRQYYKPLFEDDSFLYRVSFTYSLNNRDVRLWLKSARVAYEREFGVKLPNFTYVAVGEYGSRTHRPHYHLGFFGLDKKCIDWLVSRWNYGFTYVQHVSAVNPDGSDGFAAAAKYIGKYMSKGVFECAAVKCGYAFKGRLMSSKGLGQELPQNVVNYYRCYDVVGEFDIMQPLSEDRLNLLISTMRNRQSITIGKSVFLLPKKFIHQIWFVKDGQNVFKSSVVRKQVSAALQSEFLGGYIYQLRQNYPSFNDRQILALLMQKERLEKVNFSLKNERGMLAHQKFYLNSKF